ncbi:MAG: hypothetical protein JW725_02300, partial [Candidatus Babeliaceae bacterium]|nr:hypothetical protein [Candidatus Babeliaceae bacterium]
MMRHYIFPVHIEAGSFLKSKEPILSFRFLLILISLISLNVVTSAAFAESKSLRGLKVYIAKFTTLDYDLSEADTKQYFTFVAETFKRELTEELAEYCRIIGRDNRNEILWLNELERQIRIKNGTLTDDNEINKEEEIDASVWGSLSKDLQGNGHWISVWAQDLKTEKISSARVHVEQITNPAIQLAAQEIAKQLCDIHEIQLSMPFERRKLQVMVNGKPTKLQEVIPFKIKIITTCTNECIAQKRMDIIQTMKYLRRESIGN